MNFILNFIRFSRLHTIIGTSLSVIILYTIALYSSDGLVAHWDILCLTLVSCLGANVYIVGLNQITDVEIDKINKPYLPLASGAFTMTTGYTLIISMLLVSLVCAIYLGKYLVLTVFLSLVLGTIYSLPPIRLKRFPFWAAFCIIAVRGLIVNLLLFLHFNYAINGEERIIPLVWILTATIFVYSIIIAWFKDMPDMEGDRKYNISTFSLRFGAKRIFHIGNVILCLTFLTLMGVAYVYPHILNFPLILVSHLLFIIVILIFSRRIKFDQKKTLSLYYQFIWVLFFGEYIIFGCSSLL